MGFATSITVAIFFLSFMVIASIVYPVLSRSYNNIQESIDVKHNIQLNELNTRINILSTTANGGGNIDITVSNDGSTVLHANRSNVIVNGILSNYTVTPSGLWLPKKNAVFSVNTGATSPPIKVITENGISDTSIGV
ncbi:MAG: hypothetical protein J5U17_06955 [Candidatus Methanoperedens sp.]|nr:hypothetical protein [Candidatus Methanoperedens sp.]MCE8428644.1 hypothetical protein [Candidatus Methanoperedens sp.]